MDSNVTIKWLGISGVEVGMGEERILIDPVFSRMGFARTLFGRVEPDADAVRKRPWAAMEFSSRMPTMTT